MKLRNTPADYTVSIHCAPEMSEIDYISRIDCYLFNVRSKDYRLHEMKANVGHKSSNLEQKVGYLFHPVYTIDF